LGKITPIINKSTPFVNSTVYGISPFLVDYVTLYTMVEGSPTDYGKPAITWSSSSISARVGYYTKTKEEELPIGYEEMDLRLIVTEPNTLSERAVIYFDEEYFEIITVTSSVHADNVVYDRGIMKKLLKRPQGINP